MSDAESIKVIEREALEQMYLNALEDSKRLDTVLSWHGVNWFLAWFQDAENTTPPTRDDIDKLEEQP